MKQIYPGIILIVLFSFLSAGVFAANDITFRVNMKIKLRENVFNPLTDTLVVRGSFNGWSGKANKLTDPDRDSIYVGTYDVGTGTSIEYKFVMVTLEDGDKWESTSNRKLDLTGNPQTLPIVYFEDDSVFSGVTRKGNILFTVDLTSYINLGWFDKAKDTLQVRGAFNGWSGSIKEKSLMQSVPGTNLYSLNLSTKGIVGEIMPYKFYIKFDLTKADRTGWPEWYGWELPATMGGGNRLFVYEGTTTQQVPQKYFNDVHPNGIIPAGTTIELTFNMDMRPAMKAAVNPFKKGIDTLWFTTNWENWAISQGWMPGKQSNLKYTDPDGDSIYTLKFTIKGPVPAVVEYQTEYTGNNPEGGGFDYGRYRTRYVRKTGTAWPTSYTFPTDVYTQDPPLVVEPSPLVGIGHDFGTVPAKYSLEQNYPNPFNPTTTIEYSLPSREFVTLKVYNVLGEEVMLLVNEQKDAGRHAIDVDATRLATGVYFYRLHAGSYVDVKKMVFIK